MAEKPILSREGALAILEQVVAAKGADYVYPGSIGDSCHNFRGGEPSCIVGHALHLLGLTYDMAAGLMIAGSSASSEALSALEVCPDFPWRFSGEAFSMFGIAQSWQDRRHSWGFALEKAKQAKQDEGWTPEREGPDHENLC